MLEAAWLLAAVELNGALISRGANVRLTDRDCIIEAKAIVSALAPAHQRTVRQDGHWATDAKRCSYSPADGLLRLRLPQEFLAHKTLTLGEASTNVNVALLHDPIALTQYPDYAAQPSTKTIPAAAVDMFLGSSFNSLGAILTNGPWSLQSLHQQPRTGANLTRTTGEYFFANGAQIRVGDFRTEHGPEQRFDEYRGLLLTNRAAPLRGNGKAEAQLAIQSPSRVQFFDRNGAPVYSSEILPPGNYQIQGFGASTLPGFLEARLVDINGVTQSVTLPWSADRRLLSAHQSEWEIFSGTSRYFDGRSNEQTTLAGRFRYGLHQHWTVGTHVERNAGRHREAIEMNSRAIPNLITTAALGQACTSSRCSPTWLTEIRSTISRSINAIASAAHTIPIEQDQPSQRNLFLGVTGALHRQVHGSIQFARLAAADGGRQAANTASLSYRLNPHTSLQLQARYQRSNHDAAERSGFIGMTFYFSKHNTSVSTYGNLRSTEGRGTTEQLNVQMNYGNGGLYGPQINVAHTQDQQPKSDLFMRYASPIGDGSLRADTLSNRLHWSGSTRVWFTREGTLFTPAGDDNLVIQKLGLASVRVRHSGRDSQISDREGRVVFRKAPAWTDSSYTIDAKSIPFGVNLATGRVRIPLAANRAYLVDYRGLWASAQSWRIKPSKDFQTGETVIAKDRFGKNVFIAADGYVDLQSGDQLPLTLESSRTEPLQCYPEKNFSSTRDTQLICQPGSSSSIF